MKYRFHPVHLIVLLLLIAFGFAVAEEYLKRSDCEMICATRHTRMEGTTYYGCLCADGSVFAAPPRRSGQ